MGWREGGRGVEDGGGAARPEFGDQKKLALLLWPRRGDVEK